MLLMVVLGTMNVLNMGGGMIGAIHMDMNVMEEAILSIMVIARK